jgi:hypothetical protein
MLHRHPTLEARANLPPAHVIVDRADYEEAVRQLSMRSSIALSKRNLLTLLHKLEFPGSKRTIIKPTSTGDVVVSVVTDEEAYRNRAPGPMHPDTEDFIHDMEEALVVVRRVRATQCCTKGCGVCCGR